MALPKMTYVKAKSLDEACKFAADNKGKVAIMAGGTDVILLFKEHVYEEQGIDTVVDIKGIPDMNRLEFVDGEGLRIGALTTLFDIQNSDVVKEHVSAVADAAHYIASTQVGCLQFW